MWPAIVAALSTTAVLAGLSIAERTVIPGIIMVAGAALIVSIVIAQSHSALPILPVRLFRLSSYRKAATGLFLSNGLMIATMFACSHHLQDHYKVSTTTASFAALPMAFAALITAFIADLLITRLTETRAFRLAALILFIGAMILLTVSISDVAWGWSLIGGVLIGTGLPACFITLNRRAYAHVNAEEAGTASGFTNMLTTLGGAVTVSLAAFAMAAFGQTGAYSVLLLSTLVIAWLAANRSTA